MSIPSPRYTGQITGAQAPVQSLELVGAKVIFGLPGV